MNDREKEILTTIAEALPYMSDFKKGELIGTAKTLVMIRGQTQRCENCESAKATEEVIKA